jgi:plastocyanin
VQGPAGPTAKYIFNNTKPVNPGSSATYPIKALKPGNYFYYCFYHPTVMTGTLVVK